MSIKSKVVYDKFRKLFDLIVDKESQKTETVDILKKLQEVRILIFKRIHAREQYSEIKETLSMLYLAENMIRTNQEIAYLEISPRGSKKDT